MEYRQLGKTDIRISALGLGTMTWGEQNTRDEAFAQMDFAVGQGINFFDCAELYPIPANAATHGLDPARMALAFVNRRPFLTSKIIGATTLTQLRNNIDSLNIHLSEEVLNGIEAIHRQHPNPGP